MREIRSYGSVRGRSAMAVPTAIAGPALGRAMEAPGFESQDIQRTGPNKRMGTSESSDC
jgi:hypothetical protein